MMPQEDQMFELTYPLRVEGNDDDDRAPAKTIVRFSHKTTYSTKPGDFFALFGAPKEHNLHVYYVVGGELDGRMISLFPGSQAELSLRPLD